MKNLAIAHDSVSPWENKKSLGLTKLEYFAGVAMQGLLAKDGCNEYSSETMAVQSMELAESLLIELDKAREDRENFIQQENEKWDKEQQEKKL